MRLATALAVTSVDVVRAAFLVRMRWPTTDLVDRADPDLDVGSRSPAIAAITHSDDPPAKERETRPTASGHDRAHSCEYSPRRAVRRHPDTHVAFGRSGVLGKRHQARPGGQQKTKLDRSDPDRGWWTWQRVERRQPAPCAAVEREPVVLPTPSARQGSHRRSCFIQAGDRAQELLAPHAVLVWPVVADNE
jgi:hypothetical protein